MPIYFTSIDRKALASSKTSTKRWLESVVAAEKYTLGDIIIAFCSDDYIVYANKKFLNHDYPTDIITFDQSVEEERKNKFISGDLLISVDRTKANAIEYGVSAAEELNRVLVHGLLHLMGYDDKTEEEQTKMRAREDRYLKTRKLFI